MVVASLPMIRRVDSILASAPPTCPIANPLRDTEASGQIQVSFIGRPGGERRTDDCRPAALRSVR